MDILIKAINNPFDENKRGLEVLLKTQFVHYIDIPSLSLIIPIVDYGLRSRESKLKEHAAQVVGKKQRNRIWKFLNFKKILNF